MIRNYTATQPESPKPRRVIGRQIAIGFGSVATVAVVIGGILLTVVGQLSGLVQLMRNDEIALRQSLELSRAVREQHMHQAHWIIERDAEHLREYGESLDRVDQHILALRRLAPDSSQRYVRRVERRSRELADLFRSSLLPATERMDESAIISLHKQADGISRSAAKQADRIVAKLGHRIVRAHVDATRVARQGLASGAICILLVITVSIGFTARLRHAVIKPLYLISDAARRFGSGDFNTRVGEVGSGELRAVADAFDRMVEELENRERRLVEKERMAAIGQVAAGVAHEINNPIQIIRGYLKTMGKESLPDGISEELKIIDEEAGACQRIAEDLVVFARTPDLQRRSVSMKWLLEEAVRRIFESNDREHPVDLDVADAEVAVDPDRIRQVVANLLLNSIQLSPPGSIIRVTGRVTDAKDYELRVSDRGPGVPPEIRTRIFEPFFSERSGGSGLGLAVSQGIVRAHGGSIEVEARPGGGTTFLVRLPAGSSSGATIS